MTIGSMEELEAMPAGSTIRVQAPRLTERLFTRTATGFDYEGVALDPGVFTGHVAAGQVVDYSRMDPQAGDHYTSSSHRYIVLSVVDGQVWLMDFVRGQWRSTFSRSLTDVRQYNWTRVADSQKPEWHAMAYALGTQMRAIEAESQRVAAQWNEANAALNEARRDLLRMRQARVAQVQVVATGVTRLAPEKAAGQVPENVTVVDVVASWRREFTITTEPVAGCQCGTVTREKVAGLLGVPVDSDFGFQADCGRH